MRTSRSGQLRRIFAKAAAAFDGKIEAARPPEDVAELLACLADGGRVDERHEARRVGHQHTEEQRLVVVQQRGEIDVLAEIGGLAVDLVQDARDLRVLAVDAFRNQPDQTQRLAFLLAEARHLVEARILQNIHAAPLRLGQITHRSLTPLLPVEPGRLNGRGDWIRTSDPLLPKQMRYQTAPLPVLHRRYVFHWSRATAGTARRGSGTVKKTRGNDPASSSRFSVVAASLMLRIAYPAGYLGKRAEGSTVTRMQRDARLWSGWRRASDSGHRPRPGSTARSSTGTTDQGKGRIAMNTPIYYGGIGILHALSRHRPARLSLLVGGVFATLRASFRRLSDWREKSRKRPSV